MNQEHGFVYCKPWCLKLRDENGVKALENRVLKKMFGPVEEKVAQG
jgi:hypothetical protein